MRNYFKHALAWMILLLPLLTIPLIVSAHQPRLVDTENVRVLVTDPEISKAYYDNLTGNPRIYHIDSLKPFELYLQITVPANTNPHGRYSATLYRINGTRAHMAELKAGSGTWEPFFEPFGYDNYFRGPEFKQKMAAGTYEVEVYGNGNQGRYALAIGTIESFPLEEMINSILVIPQLKVSFFEDSPSSFLLSPFGIGYLVVMLALAGLFAKFCHLLFIKFAKSPARKACKNISTAGRWIRFGIGIVILISTIFTNWHPFLLFAGFFFVVQARTCWCPIYAALGKNFYDTK